MISIVRLFFTNYMVEAGFASAWLRSLASYAILVERFYINRVEPIGQLFLVVYGIAVPGAARNCIVRSCSLGTVLGCICL